MNIKTVRNMLLGAKPSQIDTGHFLETQRAVEAYFHRLILIGLRLQGMKFEQARKVTKVTYIPSHTLVPIAEKTLRAGLRTNAIALLSIPEGIELWKLFLEFCVRHRNKVSHGVVEKIFNDSVVTTGVCINRALILSVEEQLTCNHCSAFDTPTQWGASRGHQTFSDKEIRDLKLGVDAKEPLAVSEAIQRLGVFGITAAEPDLIS